MRESLGDLIAVVLVLIPMLVVAAIVAGLAYVLRADHWSWYIWLISAPLLYILWLFGYLTLSALTCRQLGRRYPKPRYKAVHPDQGLAMTDSGGLLTALICYRRAAIVTSLPLVPVLEQSVQLRKLVLQAYSPSVHIGRGLTCWGYIYDPDLTDIGDDVVIGGRAAIAAHSMTRRRDGQLVFVSAPVRIGHRATIGGESRVALGCVIEEDAVVEPGSVVPPFTHILAGEVWGGNPASLRRRRNDVEEMADPQQMEPGRDVAVSKPVPESSIQGVGMDEIRQVVAGALDLAPDTAPEDLNNDSYPGWDSLGQIAIAAAVFDRYGVSIPEQEVYRLQTLMDVAAAVAADGRQSTGPSAHGEASLEFPQVPPQFRSELGGPLPERADLPDDLEMLPLLDPQEATRSLAVRFHGAAPAPQRLCVVIAASFTAQPLAPSLRLWGRAFGFEIDCQFVDNDQIVQALLDNSGPFVSNPGGINVVLTRPEDLASGSDERGKERMEQVLGAIEHFASTHRGPSQLLVGTLPPVSSVFTALDSKNAEELSHRWRSGLTDTPGVTLFDFAQVVERVGIDAARANGSEVLMRAPYSPRLYQELGIALVRQVRSSRHAPAKVVAVDCDNTLWGGVVGEVGVAGIELSPDGAGRSYQLFQRYLKHLRQRGVLLVLVSKNEEGDVRAVFEQHPEMILRWDDVAAYRVNWLSKVQSLQELAGELNLGLDSFVFVDDDPAMRLEVRTRLPQVHVVPLPEDAARYCETLSRLWLFDGAQTAVDADRTRLMQEDSQRRHQRESAASLEEFLAQLELRVELKPPREPDWARVAQLTQRTNQFNLSLKRRTVEEVRALAGDASVAVLTATDRFGEYGLVGVCVLLPPDGSKVAEIDTLLLSCRALGRGVEETFLHGIARIAATQGAETLVAPYVPGPRNEQVRQFLARSGFVELLPTRWTLALASIPPLPVHVQFNPHDGSVPMLSTT